MADTVLADLLTTMSNNLVSLHQVQAGMLTMMDRHLTELSALLARQSELLARQDERLARQDEILAQQNVMLARIDEHTTMIAQILARFDQGRNGQ